MCPAANKCGCSSVSAQNRTRSEDRAAIGKDRNFDRREGATRFAQEHRKAIPECK